MGVRYKNDVVILYFNHVTAKITHFQIVGSAEPCTPLIQVGLKVAEAKICLLKNGFQIEEKTQKMIRFVRHKC